MSSANVKRQRTQHLLDAALRAMTEADARLGIEAMREGIASGGEDMATAIGQRTLDTAAASYGLDAAELLRAADDRSNLQTDAMLSALGIRLEGNWRELVAGSCAGGMLTGVRLGLMLAELIAQEPAR